MKRLAKMSWGTFFALGFAIVLFEQSLLAAYDPHRLAPPVGKESHRIWIHNVEGGDIVGSKDGGKTWQLLGHVLSPAHGKYWSPTIDGGVLAFNFLRGDSQVFATAVNAVHLKFSDPLGYQLPADPTAELVPAHAISLMPKGATSSSGVDQEPSRVVLTDIQPGKLIFGSEWSPRVGSKVLVGDGINFRPIAYEEMLSDTGEENHLLIITEKFEKAIQAIEIENRVSGKVLVSRNGEKPFQVAQVVKPVTGIGRFEGSEFVQKIGQIRANHAGVICVGTTDAQSDPDVVKPITQDKVQELRGGFQIVPSHHFYDHSLNQGANHGFVYLVVGPIESPPALPRYDWGIDGSYPLFYQGLKAGMGRTLMKFEGSAQWIELSAAISKGLFLDDNHNPIRHLRGIHSQALSKVTAIRLEATIEP